MWDKKVVEEKNELIISIEYQKNLPKKFPNNHIVVTHQLWTCLLFFFYELVYLFRIRIFHLIVVECEKGTRRDGRVTKNLKSGLIFFLVGMRKLARWHFVWGPRSAALAQSADLVLTCHFPRTARATLLPLDALGHCWRGIDPISSTFKRWPLIWSWTITSPPSVFTFGPRHLINIQQFFWAKT